jgi:hypothetical protein
MGGGGGGLNHPSLHQTGTKMEKMTSGHKWNNILRKKKKTIKQLTNRMVKNHKPQHGKLEEEEGEEGSKVKLVTWLRMLKI